MPRQARLQDVSDYAETSARRKPRWCALVFACHGVTTINRDWPRTLASALSPTGTVGCVMQITIIHFATSFGRGRILRSRGTAMVALRGHPIAARAFPPSGRLKTIVSAFGRHDRHDNAGIRLLTAASG